MKKLLLLLAIACCWIACSQNGPSTQNEMERSGKHVWSYFGRKNTDIEKELKQVGWEQNYSGKTYSSMPVVLYVYNRPTGVNWCPIHFDKYAYSEQKKDYNALSNLMQKGEIYGELYIIYYNDVVFDMGVFWMLPTTMNNTNEAYNSFSSNIYKSYIADGGSDVAWQGRINSYRYTNRRQLLSEIDGYSRPTIEEDVNFSFASHKYMYNIYGTYDYYMNNTFYVSFDGEKY